jgi:Lung seven transmembrane receptor.
LVDPGYVDLTNVKFIADGNEWSLNPQDRYDNDDDGVLEADDNFSDQGTPFPTGSPTAFVTALVTDKATDGSTMEGTSDATEGFTMEGTSEATDGFTMEGTSEATDGFTMEGTSNATAEDTENTVIDDEYDDMRGNISPTPSPTAQVEKVSNPTTTKDAKNGDDDYYYGNRRYLSADDTVIDVIFFHEPGECVKTKAGCDWAKLGVGSSDNAGNNRWCCSEDAIDLGLCEEQNLGRIIINKALFRGEHRPVTIPPVGSYEASMKLPVMDTKEGTGQYTLVLANCNDYGRDVYVDGQYLWRSKGGYLPGNLFEEWHFITFLTIGYGALLFWYGRSMYQNKDSMIGIQKWILGTVTLALIELIFKGIDYMEWNQQGMRINFAMYFCKCTFS